MKYRPEIDGIRALAVVPVIFFHAGFELFSGGFVGVDIFFVISGYLITTILIEDLENERFNIIKFYERRARRILPALYFVLLISSVVSTLLMSPQQLKDFGQSLITTVTFVSNIYFFLKADYWAQSSEFLPLLHTWSLAVEEQYYLVFPIFLYIVWRYGENKVFWMVVVMAAISLMLSEWGWRNKPIANFYLAPARVWELFAGSIAAFLAQKSGVQKSNVLASLGLGAIAFSIFAYDELTPFPSVYTLIPVLGVVLLVLYADKETLAAKLLSTKILVGIGLISYPAYLWHQPILAFIRVYQRSTDIDIVGKIYIVGATFLLAVLSFKFIERPFRTKGKVSAKVILTFIIVPLLVFIAYGTYLHNTYGLKELKMSFLSPKTVQYFNALEQEREIRKDLWSRLLSEAEIPFDEGAKLNFLFIGDSLSEDLYVVSKMSKNLESLISFRRVAFDESCAKHIVTGGREINHGGNFCADSIEKYLKSNLFEDADLIMIAAGWLSDAQYLKNLLDHRLMNGKKIIVYQTHAFTHVSSLLLSIDSDFDNLDSLNKFLFTSKRSRTEFANAVIGDIALSYKIPTLNGFDAFCDSVTQQCVLFNDNGSPFLIDQFHLSKSGSIFFEKWFSNELLNLIERNLNEEVLR
jgi:peptidoglycan/LPS O-acetylase OafA/YrhL